MAGGNFIARALSYVVNELVVESLANSRAFQRFAFKTSKAIEKATSKGTSPPFELLADVGHFVPRYSCEKARKIGQFSVARRYHLGGPYGRHSYPVVPIQKSRPFCTTGTDKVNVEGIEQNEKITVTFVDKDGEETVIKVPVGMSMLEAAHENDIELEGACEGSLACSTCHVIVMDIPYYNKLEDPTDEENDMLDLAFGLTETSRLGCQVIAKPELDGIRLALPAATRNFAVDGHVPKPH